MTDSSACTFQMGVLDILLRAYEKSGDPRRLAEIEVQVENMKDIIADVVPPNPVLLARFEQFSNDLTLQKILKGVPRSTPKPTQVLVATQAYQNIAQQPPAEPVDKGWGAKLKSLFFS